ncbi:MAG TPA: alpha/beta fold hydrolase, partial [Aggregatilineales bacterium]|nr:alpha/beta fold hydrolase [Aggregatilineales bacterium]
AILRQMLLEPDVTYKHTNLWVLEMFNIMAGKSEIAPDKKDRRFQDPAWEESWLYRLLMQFYLATDREFKGWVSDTTLSQLDKDRADYVVTLFSDALAPSNSILNPSVLKRALDTGGISMFRGMTHLLDDMIHNGGLPSSVNKTAFQVGDNLAQSSGAVVYRNDMFELIQYQPATESVYERPLLMVPPQINRFYVFDLSPEKSLVKYALEQGIQVFIVSWRNPTPTQRDWGLETYVSVLQHAIDLVCHISGSADCNLLGACSGGITTLALLGNLAARKEHKVYATTLLVSVFDTSRQGMLNLFATQATIEAARRYSKRKGVLDGKDLERAFAWMRPNDLIWNYWVNNYLMGNEPPALDILYWNSDTTRLAAKFHSDLLTLFESNPLVHPGALVVLGTPIDVSQIPGDFFVLAGVTDHITPWKACYQSSLLLGGNVEFVLSNSGHIQSILNPPGNPKASFFTNSTRSEDPDEWFAHANKQTGSWWEHWRNWMQTHSGDTKPAPESVGSEEHPPIEMAPGSYVYE